MTISLPKKPLDAETELKFKTYGKYISFLRRHPTHATRFLFRIVMPPHEAAMLENAFMGYKQNHYQCSRGTSKTFTIGSLHGPLRTLLYRNVRMLVASASMFRGGKMILKDSERLVRGQLASQKKGTMWPEFAISSPKPIRREPDMWTMEFNSSSFLFTIPTNNEEAARGTRATTMVIDERDNFDSETLEIVFAPFALVGTNFADPARGAEDNQSFYVGTISYSYKDWAKEIGVVEDLLKLQYQAHKALMKQRWSEYDYLMADHGDKLADLSLSHMRYDYTDLLIPTTIGDYKVNYPGARPDKDIRWDERDKKEYIYTYPLDKRQAEEKLDQGLVDRESWQAEHRNMFIYAAGSVYSPQLIDKATGPIYSIAEEEKKGWIAQNRGGRYVAPVLFECTDPCILGVDVARTAAFSAFVVIRVGYGTDQMFKGNRRTYSLNDNAGPSSWANVIWAEQHQHLTTQQTAALIHELMQRYNIISVKDVSGIIMDARGGGVHVRDELANPSHPVDSSTGQAILGWSPPKKVYDPDDEEFKALRTDDKAWGGLKLLATTDVINQELISFSRAQMETGKLYVAPYKPSSVKTSEGQQLLPGYLGVRVLRHQLLRIQAVPTPSQKSVRYIMPGDEKRAENQKDMLMAFLYACYGLRQVHNLTVTRIRRPPPEPVGMIVNLPGPRRVR